MQAPPSPDGSKFCNPIGPHLVTSTTTLVYYQRLVFKNAGGADISNFEVSAPPAFGHWGRPGVFPAGTSGGRVPGVRHEAVFTSLVPQGASLKTVQQRHAHAHAVAIAPSAASWRQLAMATLHAGAAAQLPC